MQIINFLLLIIISNITNMQIIFSEGFSTENLNIKQTEQILRKPQIFNLRQTVQVLGIFLQLSYLIGESRQHCHQRLNVSQMIAHITDQLVILCAKSFDGLLDVCNIFFSLFD